MKVLVDTSVWSLALRRKSLTEEEQVIVGELKELIYELRVIVIGPVRQELLSGIPDENIFVKLKDKLKAFDNLPLKMEDYEKAAELFNICRRNGIQGSQIDFLICAAGINNGISIFTTDKDFINYTKYVDVEIHSIRNELHN